ncbi:MAG TPA: integrase [Candidatus Melainabacteria bacterium]|nr:integrase [Candidatus Melainabacteria bacterium]HIN63503.1 integrase [Candidatus Obscuribacterales bacterium]
MNTLREAATDYIAMRRNLGYKLKPAGIGLSSFVEFMEKKGAAWITTRLALEWAQNPAHIQPSGWAQRLGWVRGFARYRSAMDGRTEIPPSHLLPYRPSRANPHLYTQKEIQSLLTAALNIPQAHGLSRFTYYCLFGLLAVSGMRISEVLNLRVDEVDLENGVLTINGAKFGKSRLIPLHGSTKEVLRDYKLRRDTFLKGRPSAFFFISRAGNKLLVRIVEAQFLRLSRRIGLRSPKDESGPRIHDFRHCFAIDTLLRWYRSGKDAEQRLPLLSTYLGHVNVANTYWYLTACPELLGEAVKRLERRWEVK